MSTTTQKAQRIAERLGGRNHRPEKSGNISGVNKGDTRDIAAVKAGFGSGKTLEAAQKVIERGTPELIDAMDDGKVTPTTMMAQCWIVHFEDIEPVLRRYQEPVSVNRVLSEHRAALAAEPLNDLGSPYAMAW